MYVWIVLLQKQILLFFRRIKINGYDNVQKKTLPVLLNDRRAKICMRNILFRTKIHHVLSWMPSTSSVMLLKL